MGRRSHEDERSEAISIIYCVLNARRGRNRQGEKAVRVNVTAKEAWNDAAFKSDKRGREGERKENKKKNKKLRTLYHPRTNEPCKKCYAKRRPRGKRVRLNPKSRSSLNLPFE